MKAAAAHERAQTAQPPPGADPQALLWWTARATSPLVGEEFLRTLVANLGAGLSLAVVFVAECVDSPATRARTIACWNRGRMHDNFEFDLKGTPCDETVNGRRVCWVPDGVQARYPAEQGKNTESYYGVPILDAPDGSAIGHIAFFDEQRMQRDVFANPLFHIFVERVAGELRRRQAQARADEHLHQLAHLSRVAAMGEMGSLIAHEINQPLGAILTYTQASLRLLHDQEGAAPELIEALRSAAAEAERAGEIVRHLRAFVRKGLPAGSRVECDVNAVVAQAVGLGTLEARRAGVRLSLEAARALAPARIDPIHIEQVVLNLVRNSVEALRERAAGPREIQVRTAQLPLGRIEVSVHDSGPGVHPRLAERVFEPFYSTKPDGMGIGLAICRSIVESHGGHLWLDVGNMNSSGAVFRFQLPAAT